MTELQITGFGCLAIVLTLTIVWAVMMIHNDIKDVKESIRETLKKIVKERNSVGTEKLDKTNSSEFPNS